MRPHILQAFLQDVDQFRGSFALSESGVFIVETFRVAVVTC